MSNFSPVLVLMTHMDLYVSVCSSVCVSICPSLFVCPLPMFFHPPQVTRASGHCGTRILGDWDTGALGYEDTGTLGHRETGTPGQSDTGTMVGIGVSTYCSHVVILLIDFKPCCKVKSFVKGYMKKYQIVWNPGGLFLSILSSNQSHGGHFGVHDGTGGSPEHWYSTSMQTWKKF